LISDQYPRGACGDETTITTAEETAAMAAIEALPEGIIDPLSQVRGAPPVKLKPGAQSMSPIGIKAKVGYSNGQ
jgi:hypothetical protein